MVRACDSHQCGLGSGLAMYVIYGLGTGHYLSPGGGGGGGGFWGGERVWYSTNIWVLVIR